MATSTPTSNPVPLDESLADADAALIRSQQALLSAQQERTTARNEAALAPAAGDGTTVQLALDRDLSALFNDPAASANNLFKSLICLLQIVRLLQQSNATLTALAAQLLAAPATTPAPTTSTTPAPSTTTAAPTGPVLQVPPTTP